MMPLRDIVISKWPLVAGLAPKILNRPCRRVYAAACLPFAGNPNLTGPETILGVKAATLISSCIAAVISVALDWRSHDLLTAIGSIIAGVFVATIATELTLDLIGVADNPAPGDMRLQPPTASRAAI